jgi:glycolate oxidase
MNTKQVKFFFADDAQQKNELWKLRRRVAEATKLAGYTIEEDTVVPRAELPALIKGVKASGSNTIFLPFAMVMPVTGICTYA